MRKEIQEKLEHLKPLLETSGVSIESMNPIDYGIQLRLANDQEKAVLNLYYSERKGVSAVVGAKRNAAIKVLLEKLVKDLIVSSVDPEPPVGLHSWNSWIGSDECGKGDYFGPLVVCAFWADQSIIPRLRQMGVRDSKMLSDSQIMDVAQELYREYGGRMNGIVLKPRRYNQIIGDMREKNRNLNDLLAWQHHSVVEALLKSAKDVEGVLVDQFSPSQKVNAAFKKTHAALNVVERTGAERDLAVAAASILARYQFLTHFKEMRQRYKVNFPLGAGSAVDQKAREYVQRFGSKKLEEVAKLHFKNTQRVMNHEIEL